MKEDGFLLMSATVKHPDRRSRTVPYSPLVMIAPDLDVIYPKRNDLQALACEQGRFYEYLSLGVSLPRTPKFRLSSRRSVELPAFAFCVVCHDYGMVTDFFGDKFQTRDLKGLREQRITTWAQVHRSSTMNF